MPKKVEIFFDRQQNDADQSWAYRISNADGEAMIDAAFPCKNPKATLLTLHEAAVEGNDDPMAGDFASDCGGEVPPASQWKRDGDGWSFEIDV
jgi:hypothetical protein